MATGDFGKAAGDIQKVVDNISQIVRGKERVIKLVMMGCKFSNRSWIG